MSYILDALRKSEQERKALQPDLSPTPLITPPPPRTSPKKLSSVTGWFMLINGLVLAYLFITLQQPLPSTTQSKSITTPQALAHPEKQADTTRLSTTPILPTPATSPAISDLWLARKKNPQEPEVVLKTPAVNPKLPVKKRAISNVAVKENRPPQTLPVSKPAPNPVAVDTRPPLDKPAKSSGVTVKESLPEDAFVAPNNKNTPPLLRELSPDFQANVPLSTLNVLAYADNPNERFVILDMVKYKIGQRVKQKVDLLDILPTYALLRFEGQHFRLEGP
jgi:general secretion pathway protein B